MGEVYRARDPRLGREVAIKVLPSAVADDPVRMSRFEQEARAVAALNHPNILAVYDIGEQGGTKYMVTELLEGQTLRGVMQRGALPQRQAIEYAIQIANGLAAAHDKGIVHRDLKPENIFVGRDERVKILDFGLAKQKPAASAAVDSVTVSASLTQPGTVLGTAGYMSPEQVRGQEVDARADIFNAGAVLYEMLAGRRAFPGETAVEVMHAVLNAEAPELPPLVSRSVERVVRRCIEKNPQQRFQSAKDLGFALEAVSGSDSQPMAPVGPDKSWKRYLSIIAVLIVFAAVVSIVDSRLAPGTVATFQQITYRRGTIFGARFAPDGKTVVYGAAWETDPLQIQTSQIGSPEFRALGLPPGALSAVSSTGRIAMVVNCSKLLFAFCEGTLAEVPMAGGAPRELLENVRFADWSSDGTKLAVVVNDRAGKFRLEYPAGHVLYSTAGMIGYPRIAPDGKRVAIVDYNNQSSDFGGIAVVDEGGTIKRLTPVYASVEGLAWSPSGNEIWYGASTTATGWSTALYAVSLRGRVRKVSEFGTTIRLHDIAADGRVLLSTEDWTSHLAGVFAGDAVEHPYAWLDGTDPNDLSPDGRSFLFTETGSASFNVYLRRTDGSPAARLGSGWAVSLSPDGKWALAEALDGSLTLLPTGAGQPVEIPKGDFVATQPVANSWWSANGGIFAFVGVKPGGDLKVYLQSPRGNALRAVTPALADRQFAITAGGDRTAAIPAAADKIHLFEATGKDLGELRGAEKGELPVRFAGGGRLLVARRGQWPLAVYLVDVTTGKRSLWKQLAPSDRTGLAPDFSLVVTPDLKYYAYSYMPSISQLYVVSGLK